MYVIAKISDIVQIQPKDFNVPSARLIEDSLNRKFANKVLPNIGLCVGVYQIDKCSDGLIGHSGSGIVNVHVDFQLVVFRPFKGEVIRARTSYVDENTGVWLTTGFFDEIVVPPDQLFENTTYQEDRTTGKGTYLWRSDPDAPEGEGEFWIDDLETAAFKVEKEDWTDVGPSKQKVAVEGEEEEEEESQKQPYALTGSMGTTGLGPHLWWEGEEQPAPEGVAAEGGDVAA